MKFTNVFYKKLDSTNKTIRKRSIAGLCCYLYYKSKNSEKIDCSLTVNEFKVL